VEHDLVICLVFFDQKYSKGCLLYPFAVWAVWGVFCIMRLVILFTSKLSSRGTGLSWTNSERIG